MNLQVIPPNPKAVRWYSVVVSISGCDPLDPGSNPGTAILFLVFFFSPTSPKWSAISSKKECTFGGTRTHANKVDYDLNVAP